MAQNNQLDFLKRKNAGKRLLPKLEERLLAALEVSSLNFLSLEESDQIRERASRSFPPRDELEKRVQQYPFLGKRFSTAKAFDLPLRATSAEIIVILPDADTVGVFLLPIGLFNHQWIELLKINADGFIIVDSVFSNKLVIQMDRDVATKQEVFDFAAWGMEWSNALSKLLPETGRKRVAH